MMKKILSFSLTFLLFFVLSVSALSININKNNFTSAQSFTKDDEKVYFSIEKELTDLIENGISLENRQRSGRIPGSKAEYNTAIYLKNQLSSLTNFKPVNNSSTTDGIESFEFECIIDGNIYTSQNISSVWPRI